MQHEITRKQNLLRRNGSLSEAGFAKKQILQYRRSDITANKYRIKEWDYYLVHNQDFAIALTIADNSYMGLDSISFIDFKRPWQHTKSPIRLFPMGNTGMPEDSTTGNTEIFSNHHFISFKREDNYRILKFHMDNFYNHKTLDGEIVLGDPKGDSMVVATPFETDPYAFYYNEKINCMPAQGSVKFGDDNYELDSGDSIGLLDWGRGVWTRKNTWFWGSASGGVNSTTFGFNIGYGFGDTTQATENMLFFNHKAHKIGNVEFNIPVKDEQDDFMSPWFFTSDDDRFKMIFTPIIDRAAKTNLGFISTNQHQVFGRYTGKMVLDDGTVVNIKDLLGFAEKVYNKW
ncbi:MAG: DUF2804 domain-containing protein [Anaerovoracaceae bacterium]